MNVFNHFWSVSGLGIYSSAQCRVVPDDDPGFLAFLAAGEEATPATAEEVAALLRQAGAPVGGEIAPMPSETDYAPAIRHHLDEIARARGYDSILSAASYDGDPVYGAEGAAAKAWRSAVWAYAYTELAKVQAGQRTQPSVAELIAELPAMEWPDA